MLTNCVVPAWAAHAAWGATQGAFGMNMSLLADSFGMQAMRSLLTHESSLLGGETVDESKKLAWLERL